MYKYFLTCISFSLTIAIEESNCQNVKNENDVKKEGLKGKVKSYKVAYYEANEKLGRVEKGKLLEFRGVVDNLIYSKAYNLDGFETAQYYFKTIDSIEFYIQKNYDKKNNLIEKKHFDNNQNLKRVETYAYTKNWQVSEQSIYKPANNLIEKNIYFYDSKNNLIELNEYNGNGTLQRKNKYKYFNGIRKEVSYYDSTNALTLEQLTIYDTKGNLIREIYFYIADSTMREELYVYDDQNREVEFAVYHSGPFGLIQRSTYKYDNIRNEREKCDYGWLNKPAGCETLVYDKNNNEIKKIDTYVGISTWEYLYDENNNWIKKVEFKNAKAYSIIQREIFYY